MKRISRHTFVIAMLAVAVSCADEPAGDAQAGSRTVPIPAREHGYSNFESVVLSTRAELDAFLAKTAGQQGWNNRAGFESAISNAALDFASESLVLLRHTEGSGSVKVTFEEPVLKSKQLVCTITRVAPEIGTADMAYYCFALAVDNAKLETVKLHVAGRDPGVLTVREK